MRAASYGEAAPKRAWIVRAKAGGFGALVAYPSLLARSASRVVQERGKVFAAAQSEAVSFSGAPAWL
jgi:hypothetical protein